MTVSNSVLNSAARSILRICKYDPISAAIRRDLHWLPVPFRIQYKFNSITRNCLAGRAPEYLIELCHSVNDIPARRSLRLSSQVQLLVPRYRKERSGRRGLLRLFTTAVELTSYRHPTSTQRNSTLVEETQKLTTCNSPCYPTEDQCQQCDLYYYNTTTTTPIQHVMVNCNGIKTFLFDLKMHQNRWRLGLSPRPH